MEISRLLFITAKCTKQMQKQASHYIFKNASIVNAALISIEILSQKVSTTQVPIQTSKIMHRF